MAKEKKQYDRTESPLYNIKSKKRLTTSLRMDLSEIKEIIANSETYYNLFDERKNDKVRSIQEPIGSLRCLHDRIANLLKRITPPDFLFCPVAGRSSISNAGEHANGMELIKLDITKYFPSTTFGRVFEFFCKGMGCSRDVSWYLTKLCTYDERLPTGSPISPYLSYYAHEEMWLEIKNLCDVNGYKITVYMDDIAISGQRLDGKVIWRIKQEIKKYGLSYHKEQRYKADEPKLLTGAIIKGDKLLLRNKHHLKIRDLKREIQESDDKGKTERLQRQLKGLLSYKQQVEKEQSDLNEK